MYVGKRPIYVKTRFQSAFLSFLCLSKCVLLVSLSFIATGWRRPIGSIIFIGHFLQKSPILLGSFAKNDLQLKASYGSSSPCMGWLQLVGSFKLLFSFAKEPYKRYYILQKRPTIVPLVFPVTLKEMYAQKPACFFVFLLGLFRTCRSRFPRFPRVTCTCAFICEYDALFTHVGLFCTYIRLFSRFL